MRESNRFLKSIRLTNFLSYGEKGVELELRPLNVFIGPNSSGKSNLIEGLRILRAAPQSDYSKSVAGEISSRGGISNWVWKGKPNDHIVEIQVYTDCDTGLKLVIEYNLKFHESEGRLEIVEESLFRKIKRHETTHTPKYDYYYFRGSEPSLVTYMKKPITLEELTSGNNLKYTKVGELDLNKSILSQRKDPDRFPNVTYLAKQFTNIRIYRGWDMEFNSAIRLPQATDKDQDFLLEDASNLSLIITNLWNDIKTQDLLRVNLQKSYANFDDINIGLTGGIQLRIKEKDLSEAIPATRLSDGFLRYLCLLAILCHPKPPSVICIEEPELNMHPDIIPTIAELLIDASSRTQLFVTTHSDILVSALSETPESVVVCERDEDGSHLRRLEKKKLTKWLEDYSLGTLWSMGELGGNP